MTRQLIRIISIIGILSLLPIFMGQNDCQVPDTFNKLMDTINKKLPPPPNQSKLYVTHLNFQDALSRTSMADTELAELINTAVLKGMREAQKNNNKLAVNETGHLIPPTDQNNNKLAHIAFEANLTKSQKVNKIISEMMVPHRVDALVTGQYIDEANNPKITIRPLVIVKHNQKIITRNIQFAKKELLCTDPNSNGGKKILCKSAHDQIAQAVQELLEEL